MAIDILIQGEYKDRDIKRVQRDLDLLKTQSGTVGSAFSKMSAIGVGMGAAVGAAALGAAAAGARMAVAFGVDGVKAFIADEAEAAKLAKTMSNLGMEGATAAVEANIDALQRQFGVSDSLLRPSMEKLLRSFNDVGTASQMMSLALDVSAGTGATLEKTVQALTRAAGGNALSLGRIAPELDKNILKSGDMNAITAELSRTFSGQAQTAADTYQGQLARLAVGFDELKESFGAGFINALGATEGKTGDLMVAMKNLEPAMEGLGAASATVVIGLANLVTASDKASKSGKRLLEDPNWDDLVDLLIQVTGANEQLTSSFVQGIPIIGPYINIVAQLTGAYDALGIAAGGAGDEQATVLNSVPTTFGELRQVISGTVGAAIAAGEATATYGGKLVEYGVSVQKVGGSAAAATPKVYKYAEAIKAAQKATDDGVKSFNDYASGVSESIMGLLSIEDAATLFEERNSQVKTALKDLVDYQATLSAEQTDAERQRVTELQAIYQAAQTQAAEGGASIVDTFVQQAQKVSEFGTKMRQLLAAGLNETSFKEIAAMNLENGMRVADAFLDGNIQENIRRANEAVGSVKSIADQVGLDAAKQFATAGIQMAVAMIEALLEVIGSKGKGRKALLSMMDDLAAAMNRTSYINVVTTSSGQGGVAPGSTPAMSPVEASNLADFLAGGIGAIPADLFPGFANGGPVMGGKPIIVGERGPELFVPGSNGNVVPNNAMGGNTYQITVQAGVGDPRAIGQQIVEYVKKFEQANGPVFRAA
jgi:hypothetical protein